MAETLPCPVCGLLCPVCGKLIAATAGLRPATFPFCTERCRLRDLGAWFSGAYVVAGGTVDESDPDLESIVVRSRTP